MAFVMMINGVNRTVDVDPDMPLLWVLRDELDLKGSKFGCGAGLCGACTVHLDGAAVRACQTPVSAVGAPAIATIEGMAADPVGQAAAGGLDGRWMCRNAATVRPGQIMSATALLRRRRIRRDDDIDAAMARQYLPLLQLHAHPRGDQGGGAWSQSRRRRNDAWPAMTLTRGCFLKASAAAGGGLLLQAMLPRGRRGRASAARRAQRLHPDRT